MQQISSEDKFLQSIQSSKRITFLKSLDEKLFDSTEFSSKKYKNSSITEKELENILTCFSIERLKKYLLFKPSLDSVELPFITYEIFGVPTRKERLKSKYNLIPLLRFSEHQLPENITFQTFRPYFIDEENKLNAKLYFGEMFRVDIGYYQTR